MANRGITVGELLTIIPTGAKVCMASPCGLGYAYGEGEAYEFMQPGTLKTDIFDWRTVDHIEGGDVAGFDCEFVIVISD